MKQNLLLDNKKDFYMLFRGNIKLSMSFPRQVYLLEIQLHWKACAFISCCCSNWRMGGWVRLNLNIVRIIKSAQNNGRSLTNLAKMYPFFNKTTEKWRVVLKFFENCRPVINSLPQNTPFLLHFFSKKHTLSLAFLFKITTWCWHTHGTL